LRLHVVSCIASNYLPFARVLAESVRERDRRARVSVLVVDAGVVALGDEPFEVLTPADVGCPAPELARRALAYDTQALVSSLKARALSRALRAGGAALLLDADVLVCASLMPIAELARRHGVLLSPHSSAPIAHRPGGGAPEEAFLRAGAYDGGFVGVGPGAERFCAWWDERCARDCVRDPRRRLVLSQTWLDLVPAMFDAAILRDPGVNVMGHNLHGRDIVASAHGSTIEGTPLRLFHFASFDPERPHRLGSCAEDSWCDVAGRPGVAKLALAYAERLRARGWTPDRPAAGYTRLPEGIAITPAMRRAYLDGLVASERGDGAPPPNPLLEGSSEAFLRWLALPADDAHPWLTRYLLATHRVRDDVREQWPRVPGFHVEPYLAWCASDLAAQDPMAEEIALRRPPARATH